MPINRWQELRWGKMPTTRVRRLIFLFTRSSGLVEIGSWPVPPLFAHLQKLGNVEQDEMMRTFNMGIGMTVVVSAEDEAKAKKLTKGRVIGRIEPGSGVVRLE